MIIFVDIDKTICDMPEGCSTNNYAFALPNYNAIDKINKLYKRGDIIIYWTARGTTTGDFWFDCTIRQLNKWGAKFNELRMGKPFFDMLIDDKAFKIEDI
jgi:hypothetical protein